MNIQDYLVSLYPNAHNLIKTDMGLSNDIYTFEMDDIVYCLRHSTNPAINADNLELERKIQLALKDKDFEFKEVYFDKNNGIRITYFIDNLKTLKEENNTNKYKQIIDKIKEFHKINVETKLSFDLVNKYHSYLASIKDKFIDYSKYEHILDEYINLSKKLVLSHNDLVDGNILYKDNKCLLTDYEFASLNYELFDLVSLLSENKIYDKNTRNEIINYYFEGKQTVKDLYEIDIIEKAQNLLWAAWANMMYENNYNNTYKEIFIDKIKALGV